VADDIANTVNTPEITEADYLEDNYFEPIFSYLKNDHLPTDNNAARKILLMSENYFIENNLLYKVSLPRSKTEQRVRPQNYLLCIPVNHTAKLLGKWHSILGHYGPNWLLPSLNTRFYWPKLLVDVKNISRVCEICQQSKIITNPQTAPLSPIPVRKKAIQSRQHGPKETNKNYRTGK